jgi:hypothetical protein
MTMTNDTTRNDKSQRRYKHSPWSGKSYQRPPTTDDLTRESLSVLQRHPTIGKALRPESMDAFIEAYRNGRM